MVDNAIQVVLSRSARRCCQAVRARHFHCLLYTYQLALLRATNPNSYYTGNTELCSDMRLTGKTTSSLGLFTHSQEIYTFQFTLHMVYLTKKCSCIKMYPSCFVLSCPFFWLLVIPWLNPYYYQQSLPQLTPLLQTQIAVVVLHFKNIELKPTQRKI